MIRYIDRPVSELRDGDVFSLDGGTTNHMCAVNNAFMGTIAVYCDPLIEHAPDNDDDTVRVEVASEDQPCLVRVEIIRVNVTLRLEVDAKRWAREFSFGPETAAAVARDVRGYFDPTGLIPPHLKGIVGIKDTDTALDPVGKP
jgi:hypothetical protein